MGNDEIQRSKKPGKIEKIVTEADYKKAKKVVEKYKTQLRNEIMEEQKNCKHEDFYRYEYNENTYINVCRICFHGWEENYRPFLLEDYHDLTHGKFEQTKEDVENQKKYQARLNAIGNL
jgi:hypothetical protein